MRYCLLFATIFSGEIVEQPLNMPVNMINRKADINGTLRRWMFTNFNLLVFETLRPEFPHGSLPYRRDVLLLTLGSACCD